MLNGVAPSEVGNPDAWVVALAVDQNLNPLHHSSLQAEACEVDLVEAATEADSEEEEVEEGSEAAATEAGSVVGVVGSEVETAAVSEEGSEEDVRTLVVAAVVVDEVDSAAGTQTVLLRETLGCRLMRHLPQTEVAVAVDLDTKEAVGSAATTILDPMDSADHRMALVLEAPVITALLGVGMEVEGQEGLAVTALQEADMVGLGVEEAENSVAVSSAKVGQGCMTTGTQNAPVISCRFCYVFSSRWYSIPAFCHFRRISKW